MPHSTSGPQRSHSSYGRYLLFIAGMGGLLYGIDLGIISAALLYLSRSVSLTVAQTSEIVAAVLGGGMLSSLVAGVLADWFGRKKLMLASGLMFLSSVAVIVLSHGFAGLMVGRLLQGLSAGVIAMVVPLYLAECLAPAHRGRGTAFFQFLLTVGIVLASLTGWFYTSRAEAAVAAALGNHALVLAAQDHAWRGMFLSVIYPGAIFFAGCFFLSESPRWLFMQGREEKAMAALRRTSSEEEAQRQMDEMRLVSAESKRTSASAGSLLQRKYLIPFLLACVILACTQATGMNSILSYMVLILKQAGLSARSATVGDLVVKILNCLMTLVAVALIDRKGRKFLLSLGTAGIVIALGAAAVLFYSFENQRVDVRAAVQEHVAGNQMQLPLTALTPGESEGKSLLVLYSYGHGDKMATVLSSDPDPELSIVPEADEAKAPLVIRHAFLGPAPGRATGIGIAVCIALFVMSFSVGPGVVNWLALSELMPTRIRSSGMGVALLLNQAISTSVAGLFLPVVGTHGYFAMFAFWAACTVVYFLTSALYLPETKGKTLEEIELYFERS